VGDATVFPEPSAAHLRYPNRATGIARPIVLIDSSTNAIS